MSTVASRDLRHHTADVLRQVSGGTHVTITVNGTPVAEVGPVRSTRQQFLSKSVLIEIITDRQATPGCVTTSRPSPGTRLTTSTCDDLAPPLLDTSLLIARESGRRRDIAAAPGGAPTSWERARMATVMTIGDGDRAGYQGTAPAVRDA